MDKLEEIELDKELGEYLYIQLYKKIKKMILDGEIEPNFKLPTIRKLASNLSVNNVTVVNAYNLLEKEGYVYKRVGSGTFAQDVRGESLKFNTDEELIDEENRDVINFAITAPPESLFPIEDIKNSINTVLDRDKGMAFAYQQSQGYYPLRHSIKNYLSKLDIHTTEDNIQIISGAQQGIDILSKALIDYGDVVFAENPTYSGALAVFKSRSARTISIDIKSDGLDMIDLENKLRSFKPKFIYVMPIFQNPTGYSYSMEKKKKLIELAEKHDFYIVEDDYLSDICFSSTDNRTIKSMDQNDRVIYIKSFSKISMPGLRLAFIVIPKTLYNDFLSAKHISDISTSGIIQRAFEVYLTSDSWERNLNHISEIYVNRFETMKQCIKKYMPDEVSFTLPTGGLNFWFKLPDGYSANELYKKGLEEKISISPGSVFNIDQSDNEYFRLSVASLDTIDIESGMEKFSSVLRDFLTEYKDKRPTTDLYNPFL